MRGHLIGSVLGATVIVAACSSGGGKDTIIQTGGVGRGAGDPGATARPLEPPTSPSE